MLPWGGRHHRVAVADPSARLAEVRGRTAAGPPSRIRSRPRSFGHGRPPASLLVVPPVGRRFQHSDEEPPQRERLQDRNRDQQDQDRCGHVRVPCRSLFGPYHRFDSTRQPLSGRASFTASEREGMGQLAGLPWASGLRDTRPPSGGSSRDTGTGAACWTGPAAVYRASQRPEEMESPGAVRGDGSADGDHVGGPS